MKKLIILFLSIYLFSGCNNSDVKVILPTVDNMSGVWEATSYKKNGVALTTDYSSDYFMINLDKSYSARFSNYSDYSFGTAGFSGSRVNFDYLVYRNVSKITGAQIVLNDTIDNLTYECTFTKVNSPTTYQVKNKMTTYSFYVYSYYYDTDLKDFCDHGYLTTGTTTTDIVYTKRATINLGVKFLTTLFVCIYPQKILKGKNNILFIADTTKVYSSTSSIKPSFMKSISKEKSMTLIDAIRLEENK